MTMYYQMGSRAALTKLGFDWRKTLGNGVEGLAGKLESSPFLNDVVDHTGSLSLPGGVAGSGLGTLGGGAVGYASADDEHKLRGALLGATGGGILGGVGGAAAGFGAEALAGTVAPRKLRDELIGQANQLRGQVHRVANPPQPLSHMPPGSAPPHSLFPGLLPE